MPPKLIELLMDGVAVLVVLAILYYFGGGVLNMIQAPAKLDSALGDNAALKAGAEKQGEGIKAAAAEGKARQATSEKAVAAAGAGPANRANQILKAPAVGETDYERAMNRIDRELQLR